MREKYYLIADLGYDGMMIQEIDNEVDALNSYKLGAKRTRRNSENPNIYYDGLALIKGTIIKAKDLDFK